MSTTTTTKKKNKLAQLSPSGTTRWESKRAGDMTVQTKIPHTLKEYTGDRKLLLCQPLYTPREHGSVGCSMILGLAAIPHLKSQLRDRGVPRTVARGMQPG